ncbi:Scr1 family TA system antitoxin-like transcriptional regulator [Marinactinospora thermotolerans]|uniref:Scr1 family TA system antitoxin-like transcriptional regulator n=1 Tax=Marinactinospora thermotolerans TaxID=531310 RepID=UPI003D90D8A9
MRPSLVPPIHAQAVRPRTAVHKAVDARVKRQETLNRVHPPRCEAVIDEGTLRRLLGGREVMREQARHLGNMAAR